MKKGETIGALYNNMPDSVRHSDRFPFAVRNTTWSKDFYVIVEDVSFEKNGIIAIGFPTRKGNYTRLFLDDPDWRENMVIPKCNYPLWEIAEGISLKNYKKFDNQLEEAIYELDDRLKWGKHKWYSIAEISIINPSYISWCILNQEKSFCLSKNALDYLIDNKVSFKDGMIELNNQKLQWIKSDYDEEYRPKEYEPYKSSANIWDENLRSDQEEYLF